MTAALHKVDPRDTGISEQPRILLGQAVPFGIGGRRLCYEHPTDLGKCVKILRRDDQRTVRIAKKTRWLPAWFRRAYDNNADEMHTLEREYARIGSVAKRHLPESYGMQPTDQGPGLVLDLVRDCDGGISRSLRELLTIGHSPHEFQTAYDELGDFLLEHLVMTRAILDHNIAAQRQSDGAWRLYLIDGLGDPALVPVARWIPTIGRAKIERRLDEAWARFESFHKSGGVTPDLIRSSTWGQGFLKHRGDTTTSPENANLAHIPPHIRADIHLMEERR